MADLRPAAFIDRDGVINVERDYVHRVEDFELLPGVVEGLQLLSAQGLALVVVTNQAGIAKGLYDEAAYHRLIVHMRAMLATAGVRLDAVYHCPHHPTGRVPAYTRECDCRKPRPGMLLQAAADLGLRLRDSALVGDKVSDAEAGRAAGLAQVVLVESGHALPADTSARADHRCAGLLEAARWICAGRS